MSDYGRSRKRPRFPSSDETQVTTRSSRRLRGEAPEESKSATPSPAGHNGTGVTTTAKRRCNEAADTEMPNEKPTPADAPARPEAPSNHKMALSSLLNDDVPSWRRSPGLSPGCEF